MIPLFVYTYNIIYIYISKIYCVQTWGGLGHIQNTILQAWMSKIINILITFKDPCGNWTIYWRGRGGKWRGVWFWSIQSILQVNSSIKKNANDMNEIKEGVMASSEMLVARGWRLGGLNARVVGNSNNIQIRIIDWLRARALQIRSTYF